MCSHLWESKRPVEQSEQRSLYLKLMIRLKKRVFEKLQTSIQHFSCFFKVVQSKIIYILSIIKMSTRIFGWMHASPIWCLKRKYKIDLPNGLSAALKSKTLLDIPGKESSSSPLGSTFRLPFQQRKPTCNVQLYLLNLDPKKY